MMYSPLFNLLFEVFLFAICLPLRSKATPASLSLVQFPLSTGDMPLVLSPKYWPMKKIIPVERSVIM